MIIIPEVLGCHVNDLTRVSTQECGIVVAIIGTHDLLSILSNTLTAALLTCGRHRSR